MSNALATVTPIAATDTCSVAITRGRLLATLKSVSTFVSQDPTRLHQNSIAIELVNRTTLRMVATDGHTLAKADVNCTDSSGGMRQFLLQADDAAALIKSLACKKADRDQIVTLGVTKSKLAVTFAMTNMEFSPIDASFPPYEQAIPRYSGDNAPTVGANPAYVARACDAIASFGRDAASSVGAKFSFGPSSLDPILVTFSTVGIGDFTAVIAPMRLD
jgi:DNA polymerase-3 subunit beta